MDIPQLFLEVSIYGKHKEELRILYRKSFSMEDTKIVSPSKTYILDKNTLSKESQTRLTICCITVISVVLVLLIFPALLTLFTSRIQKKKLVQMYGVNIRTFKKWLVYFTPDGKLFLSNFNRKRKLDIFEVCLVISSLGLPEAFKDLGGHPSLSKKQIVNQGEGNYRTLRQSIIGHNEKWKIPIEAYNTLSVFPPATSAELLERFG